LKSLLICSLVDVVQRRPTIDIGRGSSGRDRQLVARSPPRFDRQSVPDRVGRIDAPREVAQPAFERAPHLLSHPPCGLPVTRASRRISPPKRMLPPRETTPSAPPCPPSPPAAPHVCAARDDADDRSPSAVGR